MTDVVQDHEALRGVFFEAFKKRDHSNPENAPEEYDIWVKEYEEVFSKYQGAHEGVTAVAKTYPDKKDIRILDLGAGTGLAGKELHSLGYRNLDALEPGKLMLEQARQKKVYKELFCELLGPNRLPIENHTYDVLLGTGIIAPGHVKEDCFEELLRIVKPGGHVILSNRAAHLANLPNIENGLKKYEEAGRWRMTTRHVYEDFDEGGAKGVLHILKVNQ